LFQAGTGAAATRSCSDLFSELSLDTREVPKASLDVAAEIRVVYSKYLKGVSPKEQEKVISLIAAAEKNHPRAKIQENLNTAINRCIGSSR